MKHTLDRLVQITKGCRHDMHEPDEQGIKAIVKGNHLDNAFGDSPPDCNCNEYTIGISQNGGDPEWFNLATVIALARQTDELVEALEVAVKHINYTMTSGTTRELRQNAETDLHRCGQALARAKEEK